MNFTRVRKRVGVFCVYDAKDDWDYDILGIISKIIEECARKCRNFAGIAQILLMSGAVIPTELGRQGGGKMARTYYAEGRQVAKAITGLSLLGGMGVYFAVPGLHWGVFFGILFGSVLIGEICGNRWTTKRRKAKKAGTTSAAKRRVTTEAAKAKGNPRANANRSLSRKFSDTEILKADAQALSGTDFERLMELYYMDQGYTVQRIGGAGDHEVDLILKGKEGYKIAVQCKRWKQDVGNDIVLRLKAGKQVHGCYDAWIVTTSNFTKAAREAAERLNIRLINGLILDDMLKRWKGKKLRGMR
ncbi:restriction endonuclease [Gorillibacterium sp. CAU 1737]|uniref:restriction endonuclease n=1 Tax=Gorillibacterium sp. CAU 1737 TaxID=3140362 RepID=UPI003260D730